MAIGPSPRFLVLLIPWLLLAIALAGAELSSLLPGWGKPTLIVGLFALVGYGGFFAWVNTFANQYVSGSRWSFSILRRETGSYGYQQLDGALREQLDGYQPSQAASVQYPVLQRAIDQGFTKNRWKPSKPLVIAFDADLSWPTPLWYFIRRTLSHGWTAISTDGFKTAIEAGQLAALLPQATGTQVLLAVGQNTLERASQRTESAEWFVEQLNLASSTPTAVVGDAGSPKFSLWTVPAVKFHQLTPHPSGLP